jgi:hypothetical protein
MKDELLIRKVNEYLTNSRLRYWLDWMGNVS